MNTKADIRSLCHEFTDALTEVLAENAIGLARRGRVARAHAAVKRHPEYNEHAFCVAVETAFMQGSLTKRGSLTSHDQMAVCSPGAGSDGPLDIKDQSNFEQHRAPSTAP
jgi:hypothetical protein